MPATDDEARAAIHFYATIAALYFLRDFTVVLLLFLGFLLILFVVWRLMKMSKNK